MPAMKTPIAWSSCVSDSLCAGRLAVNEMPGQFGQEFSVDRAEQALDFAPALRPPDGGVDDA